MTHTEQHEFHLFTAGKGWWKPDANGYTKKRAEAGRFSLAEALEHCQEDWQWKQEDNVPRVVMVPAA